MNGLALRLWLAAGDPAAFDWKGLAVAATCIVVGSPFILVLATVVGETIRS
jgi:hypothetical protein